MKTRTLLTTEDIAAELELKNENEAKRLICKGVWPATIINGSTYITSADFQEYLPLASRVSAGLRRSMNWYDQNHVPSVQNELRDVIYRGMEDQKLSDEQAAQRVKQGEELRIQIKVTAAMREELNAVSRFASLQTGAGYKPDTLRDRFGVELIINEAKRASDSSFKFLFANREQFELIQANAVDTVRKSEVAFNNVINCTS